MTARGGKWDGDAGKCGIRNTGRTGNPTWKVDTVMHSLYDLERASHDIPRERVARAAKDAQLRLLRPAPWSVWTLLARATHVCQAIAARIHQSRGDVAALAPTSGQ